MEGWKPCPFCGKSDRLEVLGETRYEELVNANLRALVQIRCKRCDMVFMDFTFEEKDYNKRMEILRTKWNKRAEGSDD